MDSLNKESSILGDNYQLIREVFSITQKEMAVELETKESTIKNIENNRSAPGSLISIRMENFCGFTKAELEATPLKLADIENRLSKIKQSVTFQMSSRQMGIGIKQLQGIAATLMKEVAVLKSLRENSTFEDALFQLTQSSKLNPEFLESWQ